MGDAVMEESSDRGSIPLSSIEQKPPRGMTSWGFFKVGLKKITICYTIQKDVLSIIKVGEVGWIRNR
jgi:hypothetical protein